MRARARRRRCPRREALAPRARPPPSRRPRRRFDSRPRSRASASTPPLGAGLLRVVLVRLDDPLHELVPDDVLVAEADERDALDRVQDVLHLDQTGGLIAWEVN